MNRTISAIIVSVLPSVALATTSVDWVTIGNPRNSADSNGRGSVRYIYSISRDEITISQYTEFLNAVASLDDPYFLYTTSFSFVPNGVQGLLTTGINRSGGPGDYRYKELGSGNRPISFITWFRAARYCNWVHNGCKVGPDAAATTEDGAYTLNGAKYGIIVRNSDAKVWIPSPDEWYKAARFDPTLNDGVGGYWKYPTRSNSVSSNLFSVPGAANFNMGIGLAQNSNGLSSLLSECGAYGTDSQSYYGINDMAGNVAEWIDLVDATGTRRGVAGGSWWSSPSGGWVEANPDFISENSETGFRIAGLGMAVLQVSRQDGTELEDGERIDGFSSIRSSRKFIVSNEGAGLLSNLLATLEGADTRDFSVTTIDPPFLAPGARTVIEVRFDPTGPGPKAAKLRIASTDLQRPSLILQLAGDNPIPSEAWRLASFGSPENEGPGADSADPDGDQIVNLMEFATGSDPKKPTEDPGDIVKNGGILEYRYWRSKSAATELTFVREFAASPSGPWQQTGGTAETIISDDGVRQRVLVTTPASSAIERRFVRLRVTRR
jgi:sulfatase modifying factor 1